MGGRAPAVAESATVSLPTGTVVQGRYELLGLLGAGMMGAVYRARVGADEVALKQMLEGPDIDGAYNRQRLEQEGAVLARLHHPAVPAVREVFSEGDSTFVAMELVEGTALDRLGALPPERVVRLGQQVCAVLVYLHGVGVMHRDIKPQNLLLRPGGEDRVAVVDFGLARYAEIRHTVTRVGTPGYAPLEQFQGRPEPRSDLYALGATMHHLLTGKTPKPFHPAPLRDVPPALAAVVQKACAERPEGRFPSAVAMGEALEAAATGPPDRRSWLLRWLRGGG